MEGGKEESGGRGEGHSWKDFPGQEINPLLNPGGETGGSGAGGQVVVAKCGPTGTAYLGT